LVCGYDETNSFGDAFSASCIAVVRSIFATLGFIRSKQSAKPSAGALSDG